MTVVKHLRSASFLMAAAMATQAAAFATVAPKRDARGIPVISNEVTAPPGYNAYPATADPVPSMPAVKTFNAGRMAGYPPCTRTVTDGCVQTYERGSAAPR
jgi:hypothetical protein